MSTKLIRLGIIVTFILTLALSILVRAQYVSFSANNSGRTTNEQVAVLDKSSASTSGQQNLGGVKILFTQASPAFEPLLLLLLGSTLLLIGSGIRLVLTRKLRRSPDLIASDE